MNDKTKRLFGDYDFAYVALAQARNKEFPPGTRVRCKMTDWEAVVTEGSLYADQVNTTRGHMGWRYLDKIEQPGVEK